MHNFVKGLTPLVLFILLCSGCEHVDANEGDELSCDIPYEASEYPASTVSFSRDIAPIFANNSCSSEFCHGAPTPPSNYSLLSATDALGPGNEAAQLETCNVTRGDPDNSYLIDKLTGAPGIIGEQMPFGGAPITSGELSTIRQWITEGAPDN